MVSCLIIQLPGCEQIVLFVPYSGDSWQWHGHAKTALARVRLNNHYWCNPMFGSQRWRRVQHWRRYRQQLTVQHLSRVLFSKKEDKQRRLQRRSGALKKKNLMWISFHRHPAPPPKHTWNVLPNSNTGHKRCPCYKSLANQLKWACKHRMNGYFRYSDGTVLWV